jgi:hypothetical protein
LVGGGVTIPLLKGAVLAFMAASAATAAAQPHTDSERTADALARTHTLAQCLVRDFRPLVVRILESVPGSAAERTRLTDLRRRGRRCAEAVARIDRDSQYIASFHVADTALRGALSEALYESDFAIAGRARPGALARVAAVEPAAAATGRANVDRGELRELREFAACVARHGGDDASALLAIAPGSTGETEAIRRLVWEFDVCFPTEEARTINIPTVRGLVAEAVYRHQSALARGETPPGGTEQITRRANANSGAVVIVPVAAQAGGAAGPADSYDAEDVRNLVQFSRCIARRRPADATELLAMDYRQDAYDRTARAIATRSTTCAPSGRLRFSRLLFAGGLAEEMLAARLGAGGLSGRVSTSAPAPAPQDGDVTEAIGHCLVRSHPASVTALLATAPASAEENQVVRDMTPHVAGCIAAEQIARISQPSLRAISAIAAYRLVQQSGASRPPARN